MTSALAEDGILGEPEEEPRREREIQQRPENRFSIRAGGVNGLNIHQGDRRIGVEAAGRSCVRGRTVSVNTSERDVGKMSTCVAERALSQLISPAGMLALAC